MLSELTFEDICTAAEKAYRLSEGLSEIESSAAPAAAYAALIPGYISRLTQPAHDPVKMSVIYSPLRKRFRLIAAIMRGRV